MHKPEKRDFYINFTKKVIKEGADEYHLVLKCVKKWIKTVGKENTKMELYGQFTKTDCENEQKTRKNTCENKYEMKQNNQKMKISNKKTEIVLTNLVFGFIITLYY